MAKKTKKKTTSKTSPENMAVVYARYSSHNQQEQSIEGQLAAARKYADSKGYTIIGEYCDRAKTGTNDNREAFQKMLSDCAKHKFSVIIVWMYGDMPFSGASADDECDQQSGLLLRVHGRSL